MGIPVRGRLTTLRPADAGDIERLVAWHADPEVSRYWDEETFTTAEMEERLARADVEAWIVEENGEPAGYLQVHAEGSTCSSSRRRGDAASARTPRAP